MMQSDTDVLTVLATLDPSAVERGLRSIEASVVPDDWDRNFLAAVFGHPGALRMAVESHHDWDPSIGLRLWDSELLDIVGDVTHLGEHAFSLHWMHMQEPERLARLAAQVLARATADAVTWRLPPGATPRSGSAFDARAEAVRLLREKMDADTMLKIFDALSRSDHKQWSSKNHFGIGAAVRNTLRGAGLDEAALDIASLDEEWIRLLWEAVSA